MFNWLSLQLLDIDNIPLNGREAKRRKKMEQQEQAAKAAAERKEREAQNSSTPDYAAGLGQAVNINILHLLLYHLLLYYQVRLG